MNRRMIAGIIGKILCVEAAFMLPPFFIATFCGEGRTAMAFFVSLLVTFGVGLFGTRLRSADKGFYAKEGFVTVGLAWILVSISGALPFFISGTIPNFINCIFESVSGFTTTGATILSDVKALPAALLYWRCFSQWLGGMGVLVFILTFTTLTSKDGGESIHLFRAESPGVRIAKLAPRMRRSAAILYSIYVVLTIALFVLLLIGRVPVFDSLTIAFSTGGTGGFGIQNDSLASYGSYVQWLVTIFMFLFGTNFNIFYLCLLRNFRKILKNEELRMYFTVVAAAVILIMINASGYFESVSEGLRAIVFQVVSIITTTGFYTFDYDMLPEFSRTLLFFLMFTGACAGSTSGGAKLVRISLMLKSARRSVYKAINPRSVRLVHMDGELVDDETVSGVNGYMMLYLIIAAVGTILISLNGFDPVTSLTSVVSCLNNVGPGLKGVGPTMNYGDFSYFSKLVLAAMMLIGRLEIFPIMALFSADLFRRFPGRRKSRL